MATMATTGLGENFAKDNSFGYANNALKHLRIANTVTFASRSIWRQVRMQKQMEKSGCSVRRVPSGCIQTARSRTDTLTFVSLWLKTRALASSISASPVELRNRIAPIINTIAQQLLLLFQRN